MSGKINAYRPVDEKSPSISTLPLLLLLLLGVGTVAALPLVPAVHADPLVTNIPVGGDPYNDAVDPTTDMVYVSDNGGSSVTVIDGATNSVVATIPVGAYPEGVAVDPTTDRIYVASESGGVSVIDGSTNKVIATINTGGSLSGAAVDPTTDTIYVVSQPENVIVINGATNSVTTTISLTTGQYTSFSVAVDPDTDMVYAVGTGYPGHPQGYLSVIDGATNSVVTFLSLGARQDEVAVNPATDMVYSTDEGTIYVVDGATNTLTTTITGAGGYGIAVNPTNDKVYSTDDSPTAGHVYTIDGATDAITQTTTLEAYPLYLAADTSTNMAYVDDWGSNVTSVINGNSGTLQLTVTSQSTSGQTISGYYTVLFQGGNVVASGSTPATFTLNSGQTYTVQVDGYGSCYFDSWADTGSTSASRTITITGNMQLTAVYSCGGGSASSVTVNSVDQNGDAIFGYYTVLGQSGNPVATGFTTKTFPTTAGEAYNVQVFSYGACTFSKWADGATSDPRAVTATGGPTSLTAVYACGGTSTPATSSTIDIATVDGAGTKISGYYITLWQGGVQLQSCYSSCSFTVDGGQTYQVMASSYGAETFSHWQDGAKGMETVDVPATGTTTIQLTATYSP